jgi:hypothetical protein
MNNPG